MPVDPAGEITDSTAPASSVPANSQALTNVAARAEVAAANATPDVADKAAGPDICAVQQLAALAFEKANDRPEDKAAFDRVAWVVANDQATQHLTANGKVLDDPKAKEAAVAQIAEVLKSVYDTPSLTQCPIMVPK